MIIHGRDLVIKVGGVAVAAARSCDIQIQAATIDKSSASDGGWEHHETGRKSWSITTSHLVRSLVNMASMVGNNVNISVGIDGSVGLPFDGFVNNPTVESQSLSGAPDKIYWDSFREKFLAEKGVLNAKYYENWQNGEAYISPEDFDMFNYNGQAWIIQNGELQKEKLQGSATCIQFRITGTIGNLCQGSFMWKGNGKLSVPLT